MKDNKNNVKKHVDYDTQAAKQARLLENGLIVGIKISTFLEVRI